MSLSYRQLALPLLSIPFTAFPAFANSTTELDTLVVTATRLNELLSLPANITIITADDIKNSPSRTLPELLAQEVGVNTTSLFSHGSRSSVGLRGFGETSTQNTLILLDGRRLNDIDLSSVNFSAIPIDNIERIEIVRGSGTVLYGDGATGGTINIITKDPRNSQNYTQLTVTGGSFDHREANGLFVYSNDKFGLTANINTSENDGYRDNNRFEQDNGQLDLRLPTSSGEVYIKLGAFRQDIELPGVRQVDPSMGIDQLKSDRKGTNTPNDWADEDTEFVTLGYSANINENSSFIIDGGYRHKQQRSQFDYGFGFGDYADTTLETYSLTPRFNLDQEIANIPVSWTFGADLYIYDYKSDRANFKSNKNQPIHKLDVDQKSFALYGQSLFSLTNKTSLLMGWRTQRVRQEASDQYDASAPGGAFGSEAADLDETEQENSYELGLKHLINDNWEIYGRIGRSVRFGTVDELFEFNSIFQQVFSPLKPQVSQDIELGMSYRSNKIGASLAIFHKDLEDEIRFNPITFQNINFDDTKHDGVELSFDTQVNQSLLLKANYTYLNAEFTAGANNGNDIPLIPEHTYNVSAIADLPADFKGAISWNYVSSSLFANDLTNTFEKKIPSYQTVDLKLSKDFSGLEIALQVNNLFDEKYFNFGVNSTATPGKFNAYPMPERTAYISALYKFN